MKRLTVGLIFECHVGLQRVVPDEVASNRKTNDFFELGLRQATEIGRVILPPGESRRIGDQRENCRLADPIPSCHQRHPWCNVKRDRAQFSKLDLRERYGFERDGSLLRFGGIGG
ncbi:hypothetical protein D9M72_554900 [compost metagenome]